MNTTFNFEKDHPELYAQVQADKARKRWNTVLSYVLSVLIVLIIASLIDFGTGITSHLSIAWVSFSTTVTVHYIIGSLWR